MKTLNKIALISILGLSTLLHIGCSAQNDSEIKLDKKTSDTFKKLFMDQNKEFMIKELKNEYIYSLFNNGINHIKLISSQDIDAIWCDVDLSDSDALEFKVYLPVKTKHDLTKFHACIDSELKQMPVSENTLHTFNNDEVVKKAINENDEVKEILKKIPNKAIMNAYDVAQIYNKAYQDRRKEIISNF